MHGVRSLGFWALALASFGHARAAACDFGSPPRFDIVPNVLDQTPPAMPAARVVKVTRGDDWSGCGDSCNGTKLVILHVASTDDLSPASELGYAFESDARLAFDLRGPVVPSDDGEVVLLLAGEDDEREDLDFEVRVVAVDKAGNASAPASARVRSQGGVCRLAADHGESFGALMLVLAANALRRRRRSAPAR